MKIGALTAAGLMAAGLTCGPAARGDVRGAWLGVEGATCPKCGFALAKALNALDGVAKARLIVKPQQMEVRMQPGAWVDPARMFQLARKSNLKALPHAVRLAVTGKLEQRGDRRVLVLDQMKSPMELTLVPQTSAPEKAAQLEDAVGERLEVEGCWSLDTSNTLAVTALRRLTAVVPEPLQGGTQ
jgi:hypothetical protein